MELIETFSWTLTSLLGFAFVFSLFAVAKKPKEFNPKKLKNTKKLND